MQAKKSLGQNFLHDTSVLAKIVKAGEIIEGENVLEIGPGTGNLTKALLNAGAKVIAVEKDDNLFAKLEEQFAKEIAWGKLTLIHADILNFDISSLFARLPDGQANSQIAHYKLIANIPYNITGEIIRKFLVADCQPQMIVLMLQKEVAERIVSKDGKESILSLSVKAYGTPEYICTVLRSSFEPAPNVDSAVLAIRDISNNFFSDTNEKDFFKLVKQGFASKRKMLSNNLPELVGELKKQYGNKRAENLGLADWKKLVKLSDA